MATLYVGNGVSVTEVLKIELRKHMRAAVQAIIDCDANKLCTLLSRRVPAKEALAIARQAWFADVKNDKVSAWIKDGGLLHAVFLGLTNARADDTASRSPADGPTANNASTVIFSLAAALDDEDVFDALLWFDPSSRIGPLGAATMATTADFFDMAHAPKCAAFVRSGRALNTAKLYDDDEVSYEMTTKIFATLDAGLSSFLNPSA